MATIMDVHLARATQLIRSCQRDLNRELSNAERRDLLADNTPWTLEHIRRVVGELGDCV